MENYFDYPTTLRDPSLFMGRQELLGRIFALLKTKQNVSLVGPRRIGKTSLLNCLRSPLIQQRFNFDSKSFLFLYLDLQNRSLKTNLNFFDEVHRIIKERAQKQGYTVGTALEKDDELNMLLEEFNQRDLYPVLIMDTFDEIIQYKPISEKVFGFLRSLGTAGNLSYVIASVNGLNDILHSLWEENTFASPFPNIFASLRLTSFTSQEAREMLLKTSTLGGLPFTEPEINWVLRHAGTHPFLLQQVATLLFEEKYRRGSGKIPYEFIRKEAQKNVTSHFEDFWALLSSDQRDEITESAQLNNKKSASQENWENHHYPEICRNELFLGYLHDAGYLATFPPELKTALKYFDNPGRLGENTALIARLPFLAARIEQQKASTAAARGKIIKDTLKEAFHHMSGHGLRSDTAREWQNYNILYYRYFEPRVDLTHDAVASRLLLSERQYYRLLPKALEQLWKELLAMDGTETLDTEK